MFPTIELPPGGVSLQWVYNRVRDHLLKQGCRAIEAGMCRYRGPNDTACAAGCLIRDDKYSPDLENHSVTFEPKVWEAISQSLNLKLGDNINPSNEKLLQDGVIALQAIHDHDDIRSWPDNLRRFAARHDLVP